jgi:hypothetical protein
MAEKIGLPIRKLPKDTSLYPIMGVITQLWVIP